MKNSNFNSSVIGKLAPQKVIFCDIDGTLLDENKYIHSDTKTTLKKLINDNYDYHFALASGRNLVDELLIYKELGLKNTGLLIACNGAQIYSLKSHKIIYEQIFLPNDVSMIYSKFLELLSRKNNISLLIGYKDSSSFCINIPKIQWERYHIGKIKLKDAFSSQDVVSISIFYLEDVLDEMVDFLKTLNVEVIKGKKLTAITPKGITKASAIIFIKNNFNLEIKNLAVIGNSKNDVSMFEIPGIFSITHFKAKEYLKKIATKVINLPESQFITNGLKEFKKHIDDRSI